MHTLPTPLPTINRELSTETQSPKSVDIDIVFKNNDKYSEGLRFEYRPGLPPAGDEGLLKLIQGFERKFINFGHRFGNIFNKYEEFYKIVIGTL